MSGALFTEKQRVGRGWPGLLVLALVLPIVFLQARMAYRDLVLGIPTGHHPGPDWMLVMAVVGTSLLMLSVAALFWFMHLVVEVTADAVSIQFWPLHKRLVPIAEIAAFEVRQYRPIREYGGWGIRFSFKRGMAYNVSGDMGVQLVLKNGKGVLLGSQRAEELCRAIERAVSGDV